jgi:hypothetical protein
VIRINGYSGAPDIEVDTDAEIITRLDTGEVIFEAERYRRGLHVKTDLHVAEDFLTFIVHAGTCVEEEHAPFWRKHGETYLYEVHYMMEAQGIEIP